MGLTQGNVKKDEGCRSLPRIHYNKEDPLMIQVIRALFLTKIYTHRKVKWVIGSLVLNNAAVTARDINQLGRTLDKRGIVTVLERVYSCLITLTKKEIKIRKGLV